MQGVVLFRPFIINLRWLILLVSVMMGYSLIRLRLKDFELLKKVVPETIFILLDTIILVGKMSLILFHPVKFIANPMTLIYFSGGTGGFILGLAIGTTYLFFFEKTESISVDICRSYCIWGYSCNNSVYGP